MARQVQFDRFGDASVLTVREVAEPQAAAGQVRVRVRAAGLNPFEHKVFSGAAASASLPLPSGNGNDFAGTVDQVGQGVTNFVVGDEVFGGARWAQADFLVVDPASLHKRPEALPVEQAGALDIAGRTAWAGVAAVAPKPGDTVLVGGAAGGVGILTAQLAAHAGARVLGTASEANHAFLRSLGIAPVLYGEGLVDRVRELAPEGITAALDAHGCEVVDAALALGVSPTRINAIANRAAVAELGILGLGASGASFDDLDALAKLIANGEVVLPIDSSYPLDDVRSAYERLMGGHVRGKVVLLTE
ncbi:MAG: NADP-dependent oxidoreductase [Salinibacterium sp.]|nr:MAG: NADP-dependent oxidoreductase [Salinibacterium sp.]